MPIGLGLAASHAPNVFIEPENWDARYKSAIADVPQPLAAVKETLEVRKAYAARIEAAFAVLRSRIDAYKPDVIILVSDDHNEMYDENMCQPNLAMFLGETGTGVLTLQSPGQDPSTSPRVTVKCHSELADHIAKGLVELDFDLTVTRTSETHSIGKMDRGMGHGFTRTAPKIMPALDIPTVLIWLNCYFPPLPTARRCINLGKALADICAKRPERIAIFGTGGLSHDPRGPRAGWIDEPLDIPTVLIWLNCYFPPLPTARRCINLGKALADICAKRPERIAIFGTGGLSHDPRGPRAGWIDEPLDRSVLKALADGEPDRLSTLYTFDSDTFHGGTGEIRNWLVVGGAMGAAKATVVDYMAVHHIITGVGFAYWDPANGAG